MIIDEIYNCENFSQCGNTISYNGRGRKSSRCKECQLNYSKKLRRDAYRKKVKDNVKIARCKYEDLNGKECEISIPYITRKPHYCPKHARKIRIDWMKRYYTRVKEVKCEKCGRPIKYETKRPELCSICRAREKIEFKRQKIREMSNAIRKDT